MNSRVIGSILLIIAMSIGAGLLSLPVITAATGFFHATVMLIVIWLIITVGALFILEVCLWLPEGANLVSMSRSTLGVTIQIFTWLSYLLMMYCALCVYISGGTDLIQEIWQSFHIKIYTWVSTVIFVFVFGAIVWHGIKLIDYTNRALMTSKMLAYVLLIVIIAPTVHASNLPSGPLKALPGMAMPAIFSFCYASIIPSLRSYLKSNRKELLLVILIGSFIPLLCFIIWNYTVQGSITQQELVRIAHSGTVLSQLNARLSAVGNPWVVTTIHIFTSVCVLTAFLSIALSLSDFISNGIKREKKGKNKWLIYGLTLLPPLLITASHPNIFIASIRYSGILVVVLLVLLPTLMAWKGRYNKALTQNAIYRVPGGVITTSAMLAISIILLILAWFKAGLGS